MTKTIKYGINGRNDIKEGVDSVANAVKVTLGPRGRNVIIDKEYGNPVITKDGATVAKAIKLEDPVKDMGARLIIEVASKTSDTAGDGTTTATILAQTILSIGMEKISTGGNPIEIKKGIDLAVQESVKYLKEMSVNVDKTSDKLLEVATISANSDSEVGNTIIKALNMIDVGGLITIEEALGTQTTVVLNKGLSFDRGFCSQHFINTPETQSVVYENPIILITNQKITSITPYFKLLNEVSKNNRSILIIADDIEDAPLNNIILNKLNGILNIVVVRCPGYGGSKSQELLDIAALVNTEVIGDSILIKDIDSISIDRLGIAQKIIVTKDSTTIINKKEDNVRLDSRINVIKSEIESETSVYGVETLNKRLSKLSGGIATINVGAVSEIEMLEKKDRFDDALHAVIAAMDEGIVPGGGVTLLRVAEHLNKINGESEDQNIGIKILQESFEKPIKQLLENAGIDSDGIISEIKNSKGDYGFDVRNEVFCNMLSSGIIDPVKVVRLSIENAASIAGILLTTECVISNNETTN